MTLAEHDSRTVVPWSRQALAVEPCIQHSVIGRHQSTSFIPTDQTTDRQDPSVSDHCQWNAAPGRLHLGFLHHVEVRINHTAVGQQNVVSRIVCGLQTADHVDIVILHQLCGREVLWVVQGWPT